MSADESAEGSHEAVVALEAAEGVAAELAVGDRADGRAGAAGDLVPVVAGHAGDVRGAGSAVGDVAAGHAGGVVSGEGEEAAAGRADRGTRAGRAVADLADIEHAGVEVGGVDELDAVAGGAHGAVVGGGTGYTTAVSALSVAGGSAEARLEAVLAALANRRRDAGDAVGVDDRAVQLALVDCGVVVVARDAGGAGVAVLADVAVLHAVDVALGLRGIQREAFVAVEADPRAAELAVGQVADALALVLRVPAIAGRAGRAVRASIAESNAARPIQAGLLVFGEIESGVTGLALLGVAGEAGGAVGGGAGRTDLLSSVKIEAGALGAYVAICAHAGHAVVAGVRPDGGGRGGGTFGGGGGRAGEVYPFVVLAGGVGSPAGGLFCGRAVEGEGERQQEERGDEEYLDFHHLLPLNLIKILINCHFAPRRFPLSPPLCYPSPPCFPPSQESYNSQNFDF